MHNTRFQSTRLNELYQTIELTHRDTEYTWDDFSDDFELRDGYAQMRFGFMGMITHRDWPLMVIAEAMSSPSTYEKMSYAVIAGLGKEFFTYNKEFSFYFMSGMKFVKDRGFGSATLVNSIGNKEARDLVATYFDPVEPLGKPSGNLFTVRAGVGKILDRDKQMTAGIDLYGELDMTPTIVRNSRMHTYGVNAYVRFSLNRTTDDAQWVPDFYHRRNRARVKF